MQTEDFAAPTAVAWQCVPGKVHQQGRKQEKTITSDQFKSYSQKRNPGAELRRNRNQQQKQKLQRLNLTLPSQPQAPLPPPSPPQASHPLDQQQYIYYNNNDWQENDDQAELSHGFVAQSQPPSQLFHDGRTEGNDNNGCCPLDIEDTCEDDDEYDGGDSRSPQPLPAELRRRLQQGPRSVPPVPLVHCVDRHRPVVGAAAGASQQKNCDLMQAHPRGLHHQQQQQLQQSCRRQSIQRSQIPPSQQFHGGRTEDNDNNDCCPLDIEDTCEDEDEYDGDSCSPQPLPAELRRRRQQGPPRSVPVPSMPPVRRCPVRRCPVRCVERPPVVAAAAAASQQNNCDPMQGHPRGFRRQQQQPLQQCCRRQSVQRSQIPPSCCKYDPQSDGPTDIYDGPVCEPPRHSAGIYARGNSCGDGVEPQKIHLTISVIGNCSCSLKTADAASKADFDSTTRPRSGGGNCMPIWGGDSSHVGAAGTRVRERALHRLRRPHTVVGRSSNGTAGLDAEYRETTIK